MTRARRKYFIFERVVSNEFKYTYIYIIIARVLRVRVVIIIIDAEGRK